MARSLPLTTLRLLLALLPGCTAEPTTADGRQAVPLPMEAQDAVRAEINTMPR